MTYKMYARFRRPRMKTREICGCCYGTGILSELDGKEGSCMTCNGKGYLQYEILKDSEPCSHPGCSHHSSHSCEGCGRINGISEE